MSASQQLVDSYVNRAVEEFKGNPLASRLLRRLSEELPEQFCVAALQHLERSEESGVNRLLTILMMGQPMLPEYLANPALGSRERSLRIVKRLVKLDPSFDVRLARMLPDRTGINHHEAFSGVRAYRILDILDQVSRGRRLLPVLAHLAASDDPKIAAKATLFVGRRVQSAEWAARQLRQQDPRVRANAVESIWGLRNPVAVCLLEGCVDDSNNRVAGNALVGLHLLDTPGVAKIIQSMAEAPKANFRSTAAWVMGRIASPEFAPELNRLLKDDSSQVRGAALRALIEVRRYESQSLEMVPVRASQLSEEEVAERAAAVAEMLEPEVEMEFVPAPIELRLDGSRFSYKEHR